jgi:hypothetical protein
MTLIEGKDYELVEARANDLKWGDNVVLTFKDGRRAQSRVMRKGRGWDVHFEGDASYATLGEKPGSARSELTKVELVQPIVGEIKL